MTPAEHKRQIEDSLALFADQPLGQAGLRLFEALGYKSERRIPFAPNTADNFIATFDPERRLKSDQALIADWQSVDFLFQLSDSEIRNAGQGLLSFDSKGTYDGTIIESYLFLAIALVKEHYTRTQFAAITRAVNRLFNMPVMLLFRHGDTITIAVIRRRLHKRDESKDVLDKVTLIKEISSSGPHRAHIEILYDLSVDALSETHYFSNFVELHNAWQHTLDISELNRRFYKELSNWYFWAMNHVWFPDDTETDPGIRNATNLIRLVTRIIFIWFIREKGLIPPAIFERTKLVGILRDLLATPASCGYYRAILQNLFFGTLNQKMEERGFARDGKFTQNRSEYGVKNLFRYADLFAVDEREALSLFKTVPFLNGGLFDCLDKQDDAGKVIYVDGFSRNPKKQATVPDFLFFADEREVDLNEIYGTKDKTYKTKGLFEILSGYKFTVTENTPIEEEVALDPELLGKVFENLLASHNPETQLTARKQTGSFYTPREIVDYMVDESLKAYLKSTLTNTSLMNEEDAQIALDVLFAYTEKEHLFNPTETEALILAIDSCKILDPACGSGAFPMGILHKMVHILHKLDPHNEQWKKRQINKVDRLIEEAQGIPDGTIRGQVIAGLEHNKRDIEDAFESNELDYGRKLYLIENCVYGVDIQPIAVQIAKLRFFISLVIDQTRNTTRDNLGIRALPNLETKFVAANTLIGLNRPKQDSLLRDRTIDDLEKDLRQLRHRYFSARTRTDKMRYQNQDNRIRQEIGDRLKVNGWDANTARQIVRFDPYDLNASADFFEPEWMFGVTDGFDVVIGNPPYVRADSGERHLAVRRQILESGQYETLWEKWDLFIPFMERSFKLLKPGGVTTLIVSDAYCHSKYAQKSQDWFLKNSRILRLDFLSRIKVFDAAVHNVIYFFQRSGDAKSQPERRVHQQAFGEVTLLPTDDQTKLTYRAFFPEDRPTSVFSCTSVELGSACYISVGMVVHANEKVAKGAFELDDVVADARDSKHPRRFVEGKHLERWIARECRWLEWGTSRAPALFRRPTFPELYAVPEKIFIHRTAGEGLRSAYDVNETTCNHTVMVCLPWHSLSGVRNPSLKKAARYRGERPPRQDLPKREELEATSRRFNTKYLLGVMNSSSSRDFLRAKRRSNTDIYPEDWKNLPIPDATQEQQAPIIGLVDQILNAKRGDISADVSALESQIDQLVYRLYNLTPDEMSVAEANDESQ
jgi:adenine-specific DNA-methyltransferase